jgi:hypothetical protein
MKVNYVKLGFLALLFICLYSIVVAGHAEVVWSDDFDDGDYEGWIVGFGEWEVINGTLQGQEPSQERPYSNLERPSTIAYGTWSLDVKLQNDKTLYISFIDNNSTFATYGQWYEISIQPRKGFTEFNFHKVEGAYPDTGRDLIYHSKNVDLQDTWHHIDITRDLNGKFSFFLDSEFLFDVVDNSIMISENFGLTSQPYGAFIDNIEVSDEIHIWHDDFDDGEFDGWLVRWGNWTAADNSLQALYHTETNEGFISHPSSIAYGTWSFDIFLEQGKDILFFFVTNNHTYYEGGYNYVLEIKPFATRNEFYLVKVLGEYPIDQEVLAYKNVIKDLSQHWHHIDITRDITGRISVYLDSTPVFDIIDTSIDFSEYFTLVFQPEGTKIDNIAVSDEIRIWADDFNDGDYDGWTVVYGNWTVTNNSLQALPSRYTYNQGGFITHPSSIAFGTWSLDIKIRKGKSIALFPISTNHTHYYYGHLYYLDLYPGTQQIFGFAQLDGIYPENGTGLADAVVEYIPERWYHLDITRDIDGRFCVYFNGKRIIDVVDSSVDYSEDFDIASYPTGCLVDNITVIDTVKDPLNVTVDITEELVTQGDEVLVEIENVEGAYVSVSVDDQVLDVTVEPDGVYRAVVETSNYLGTVELVVTAEKFGFISLESIYQIEVVAPAEFVFSDLSLEPSTVQIGETVVISAEVSNVGGIEGTHHYELRIDGVVYDMVSVTLGPDVSETIMFEYTSTQSGTFTVDLDGLTGSITVLEPASFEVSNLLIEPDSVNDGDSVTISVECSNIGGVTGSYDVVLKIDGEAEVTSEVTYLQRNQTIIPSPYR